MGDRQPEPSAVLIELDLCRFSRSSFHLLTKFHTTASATQWQLHMKAVRPFSCLASLITTNHNLHLNGGFPSKMQTS